MRLHRAIMLDMQDSYGETNTHCGMEAKLHWA